MREKVFFRDACYNLFSLDTNLKTEQINFAFLNEERGHRGVGENESAFEDNRQHDEWCNKL